MRYFAKWICAAALVVSLQAGEGWLVDFEKAKTQAAHEGKAVLMDFTGSDWCAGCIQLKKNVFNKPEFKEFAAKNLVLLEVDFPNNESKISKETLEQNKRLEKDFKIEGFPTLVVLDKTAKEIGRLEYTGENSTDYIKKIEAVLAKAK
jgi:thioredoxin-related protein